MKKLLTLLIALVVLAGCRTAQKTELPRVNEGQLGEQAFEKGQYSEAVTQFDKWLVKYPNDANVLFYRGRAYRMLRKYNEALSDFNKAAAAKPRDLGPKVYQCMVLMALNRTKEARVALDGVMGHKEFAVLGAYEKFMVYYTDGQMKNAAGAHQEAFPSLDEAEKIYNLRPDVFRNYRSPYVNRFVYYQRSVAYYHLEDFARAAAELKKYITVAEKAGYKLPSKDYQSLALAYFLAGETVNCRSALVKVSKADRQALYNQFQDPIFSK